MTTKTPSDTSTDHFNPQMTYEMVGGNNADNIGANTLVVRYNSGNGQKTNIMIDRGLMFGHAKDDARAVFDGIMTDCDKIYPDIDALVVTHAHMDHIGAISCDVLRGVKLPPIYCTPLTQAYIQSDMIKKGIMPNRWPEFERLPVNGKSIVIGDMTVSAFPASHSIPEACGLIITSPAGSIAHSGDFKTDPTVPVGPIYDDRGTRHLMNQTLRNWPEQGQIDMLAVDSTRSATPGFTPAEKDVGQNLREIIEEHPDKRIVASMFSTHLSRILQMADIAADTDRTLVVHGAAMVWSMKNMVEACKIYQHEGKQPPWLEQPVSEVLPKGKQQGFNHVEAVFSSMLGGKKVKIIEGDHPNVKKIPTAQQLVVCTGTQGEVDAALSKAARGDHTHLILGKQDLVIISGSVIPGNEPDVGHVISSLQKKTDEVITVKDKLVHTSGHGRAEDINMLVEAINPRVVLPIHGSDMLLQQHQEALTNRAPHDRVVLPATQNGHQIRIAPGQSPVIEPTDKPAFIGVVSRRDGAGKVS